MARSVWYWHVLTPPGCDPSWVVELSGVTQGTPTGLQPSFRCNIPTTGQIVSASLLAPFGGSTVVRQVDPVDGQQRFGAPSETIEPAPITRRSRSHLWWQEFDGTNWRYTPLPQAPVTVRPQTICQPHGWPVHRYRGRPHPSEFAGDNLRGFDTDGTPLISASSGPDLGRRQFVGDDGIARVIGSDGVPRLCPPPGDGDAGRVPLRRYRDVSGMPQHFNPQSTRKFACDPISRREVAVVAATSGAYNSKAFPVGFGPSATRRVLSMLNGVRSEDYAVTPIVRTMAVRQEWVLDPDYAGASEDSGVMRQTHLVVWVELSGWFGSVARKISGATGDMAWLNGHFALWQSGGRFSVVTDWLAPGAGYVDNHVDPIKTPSPDPFSFDFSTGSTWCVPQANGHDRMRWDSYYDGIIGDPRNIGYIQQFPFIPPSIWSSTTTLPSSPSQANAEDFHRQPHRTVVVTKLLLNPSPPDQFRLFKVSGATGSEVYSWAGPAVGLSSVGSFVYSGNTYYLYRAELTASVDPEEFCAIVLAQSSSSFSYYSMITSKIAEPGHALPWSVPRFFPSINYGLHAATIAGDGIVGQATAACWRGVVFAATGPTGTLAVAGDLTTGATVAIDGELRQMTSMPAIDRPRPPPRFDTVEMLIQDERGAYWSPSTQTWTWDRTVAQSQSSVPPAVRSYSVANIRGAKKISVVLQSLPTGFLQDGRLTLATFSYP